MLYQFLLLLFFNFTLLHAAQTNYNALNNPGFETGMTSWASQGEGVTITTVSHTGSNAIVYSTGGTSQTTDFLPDTDGTKAYILSGYSKNSGSVEGMWLGMTYMDKEWNSLGDDMLTLQYSAAYALFELNTTPPAGTKYISFWTWSEASQGGKTYLDDMVLSPLGFGMTPCNILLNDDFEQNSDHWSIYSAEAKRVSDAYSGQKALRIKDGGLDQISLNTHGKIDTYQFNGYYKTADDIGGVWVGLNFYNADYELLFSKTLALEAAKTYQKFVVNATSTEETAYIQAWIWSDAGAKGGKVILDALKLSPSGCYSHVLPSSLPPHGMSVSTSPQFVVIGFDDNTKSEGIAWALDLFSGKKNADGTDARVSFYNNTVGLDVWIEDDPQLLLQAQKALKESSHEVANHTYNHHRDLDSSDWDLYTEAIRELDQGEWDRRIGEGGDELVNKVGVLREDIVGFRAPFLLYNQYMLNSLKAQNYLYDCSIEEGYASKFDGTNFRWPYQLNEGSPGHNESWYGNPQNSDHVVLNPVAGLWEVPNHVLMIPKNSQCHHYGIQPGLWSRLLQKLPYLSDFKITGFDYNLWHVAALNKSEVLGILKYNLDLRLQGNRAPFMFGAHTQYYTDEWSVPNAPNATTQEMREAISEFVTYALSKPEVRIRPAVDIVNWCINPVPLN